MRPLLLIVLTTMAVQLWAQSSAPQFGHTHDILEVKFNSDASRLISYSWGDGWLCLWEVESGRLLWRTKTGFVQKADERYTLTTFAFSPDQNLLVSGSANGTIQLWDGKTGKILWRADAHQQSVTAVAFDLEGTTIVSAASPKDSEDEIKVLRVADGYIVRKLEGKSCAVVAIGFDDRERLKTGCLNGSVLVWDLGTGKQVDSPSPARPRARRPYPWETSFTSDLKSAAMRTGPNELTLKDTQTDSVKKRIAVEGYRIYSKFSADGNKLVVNGYGGFTLYDLTTWEERKIDEFSRTGSTFDLSHDGKLFTEGGSWGNAAIKITETATGKSRLIGVRLHAERIPRYKPSELEVRLTREKQERQVVLRRAKDERDRQAAIDAESFQPMVYITFVHYGDMTDPGELRMAESGEPDKSRTEKPVENAGAIWLRLHNDSPLPIEIPTQSIYRPDPKCTFDFPSGVRIVGLCDNREISVWYGLEEKNGKEVPYGFDFGSSAILLPGTSAVFAVPHAILRNGRAIRFSFTFQKETRDRKVEDYGEPIVLRFGEANLPDKKQDK